mmetsp:Transcript_39597/g.84580  ORF Transcript_39597/g.84580 Transcript_39597/m.84580 type:complete len:226 (-) Transcript_39597:439-1116(-)
MPPRARALKNRARCRFMRHHCTKRRSVRMRNWPKKPGREVPPSIEAAESVEDAELMPSEEETSDSEDSEVRSLLPVSGILAWGPVTPVASVLRKFSSRATSSESPERYSKNCSLVMTFVCSPPAICTINSPTTSSVGIIPAQCASNSFNSSLSITPSLLTSTVSHPSCKFLAKTALSSSGLSIRDCLEAAFFLKIARALSPSSRSLLSRSWRSRQRAKSMSGLKF